MRPRTPFAPWVAALSLAAPALLFAPVSARALGAMPEAIASYRIAVRYDPVTHIARGTAHVTWVNTSGEAVPDLQFHLYLNAFKNMKSSFLREADDAEAMGRKLAGRWGWIDIRRLALDNGADLTRGLEFIAPDDNNHDDQTVARVTLPRPLPPGDVLRMTIDFEERIPYAVDRAGWSKDFVMAAQWFPKLGVYQPARDPRTGATRAQHGWNCHQFHSHTEFFADFGEYDISITVPKQWTIGATGQRVERHTNVDGTATERWTQRGVHDFAWTASPSYHVDERVFRGDSMVSAKELAATAALLGRTPEQVRLSDVRVTLLSFPAERGAVARHFRSVFAAIKYLGLWYAPYPYEHLTVVIPPYDAAIVGGMEYPTLFLGDLSFLSFARYGWMENTDIHEYAHQYWYGLMASNEFEESWLDEGFASYATAKVQEITQPRIGVTWRWGGYPIPGVAWHSLSLPWALFRLDEPDGWAQLPMPLFGVFGRSTPTSELMRRRRGFLDRPATDDVVRNGWEYSSGPVYGTNSYSRPTTILATLERLAGSPAWPRVMRTYAENYRFKHPTTRDFLATLNTETGKDWSWFFDQFLWGSRKLDYAVSTISNDAITEAPGMYDTPKGRVTRTEAEIDRADRARERLERRAEKAAKRAARDAKRKGAPAPVATAKEPPTRYDCEVRVQRLGDAVAPVELAVYFSDSTVAHERWDGRYQWAKFRYTRAAKIDSAVVDPEGKWLLDVDRLNNSRVATVNHRPAQRWTVHWLLWVESFLQVVGWLA
jgi:hypothetical protein